MALIRKIFFYFWSAPRLIHKRSGHSIRTMKYFIITILGFGLLTGCTYRPKEKRLTKFKNEDSQILESFYKKTSDTIEFKRVVSNGTTLKIQSGQIFLGEYALTHQKFNSV